MKSNRHRGCRLSLLHLECRALPSSTLYLDFGDNFPAGGLDTTVGQLRSDFSAGGMQGPDLRSGTTYVDTTALRFFPASQRVTFDYNGSGTVTSADWTDLRANVLSLVQRYYAPFDVNVVLAPALDNSSSATYVDGVRNTLMAGPAVDGERDAWAFGVYAVRVANGASVGSNFGIYGIASGRDIGGNNANDDACLICCDIVFANFGGAQADTAFGYTMAHEPAHNFGLAHTSNVALSNSDIIVSSAGSTNRTNFDFFTRYPLTLAGGSSVVTNYDRFANPNVLGLRPNTPVYVTGTGENDIITVTRQTATTASVSVQAFSNTTYTTPVTVPGSSPPTSIYSYTVALDPSLGLFIDSGFDNDRIIIDATIGVPVTVRGMASTDQLIVHGNGLDSGTYTPNSTAPIELDGNASYGGQVIVGDTTISLSEFETASTIEVDGVTSFSIVTPNSADVLTVDTPADGRFRVSGTSGGLTIIPLIANVTNFTLDTAANDGATPNDSVAVTLGGVTTAGRQCTISTGAGTDAITVTALAANTTLNLRAGTGDDSIAVDSNGLTAGGTVDTIRGAISVIGQSGADTLLLEDSSDTTGDTLTVDDVTIGFAGDTFFGVGGQLTYVQVPTVTLNLSAGTAGDLVSLTPSPVTVFNINGNSPAAPTSTGDRLTLTLTGVTNPVRTPTSAYDGSWAFADRHAVNYTGFEDQFIYESPMVIVGDATNQRSHVSQLRVVFDNIVDFAGAPESAFLVEKIMNGVPTGTVGTSVSLSVLNGATVATITFNSDTEDGSLVDGRYRLTVVADQVNLSGVSLASNSVMDFHRLFGDVNGDATVNGFDLGFFKDAFGTQIGDANYLSYFDFDGDGVINGFDFGQFRTRFGTMLP
jgi:hypothetical protein